MMLRTLPVVAVLCGVFAFAAACGTSPAAPSAASAAAAPTTASIPGMSPPAVMTSHSRPNITVSMMDACDSTTFNLAVGPGTCSRNGGVNFNEFVAQLTAHGTIGAWHFAPGVANANVGDTFLATNKGGEVHTFTEVADFGGGVVDFLNQLAGTPNIAPECAALENDDFVAPGGTYTESLDHSGTVKFQCCIHPWMRLEAKVR